MKVVLRQDVKNIGKKDEMHEVSDGYARNFLLPRGLAVAADSAAVNEVKTKAAAKQHHEAEIRAAAVELAGKIDGRKVVIRTKGGQSGKLFGAITVKDIAAALTSEGIDIDKRKLSLSVREIKTFGTYEIEARVAAGIAAKFTCEVVEE